MKKFLITLLILALILSGTNLTAVHADELTPASEDSVLNQNIVFSQDDNPITGSSKINVNKVIKAEIKMSVNLDPDAAGHSCITKNNYITYALGGSFKFAGRTNESTFATQIKDKNSGQTAAEAIFTRDSSGNIAVKFDFSKANDSLFALQSCEFDISTDLIVDTDNLDYSDPKPVKILGNEYSIDIIPDTLTVEKSGEVDWSDVSVKWTVKVNRHLKNKPEVSLPLTGFKFEDNISGIGEYVPDSLTVSGSAVVPEEAGSKVIYTLKDGDLNSEDKGTAVITFKTKISSADLSNGRTYRNEAKFIGESSQATSNKCDVTVKRFGSKSGQVINGNDGRKIRWVVDFNEESKDIGEVLIRDVFTNDYYRNEKTQTYESNEYQTFENGVCITTGTAVKNDDTFTIPDVKNKTRLIIYTKTNISPTDPEYYVFNNTAEVRFGINRTDPKAVFSGSTNLDVSWISKGASLTINDNTIPNRAGFLTDWDVSFARKNSDSGDYKLYDVFIFDNSIRADRSTINDTDYKVTEVGSTDALADFVPLSKIVSNVNRHQRLINPDNANVLTKNENNIQHSVYEIRKTTDDTIVGHILELTNFPAGKSSVSFQSKMIEPEQILSDDGQAYNYMALIKDGVRVDEIHSYPIYKSELIRKQVLSRDAAASFLADYNTSNADANVFSNGNPINNADIGYNKETRTIIYKLSINGADIKDTDNDLGDITVTDEINSDFEFVNIKGGKKFLIYEGKPTSGGYVNTIGNELSDSLTADALVPTFNGNKMSLSFKKLDKPYVVFIGMKLKESSHGKYLNSYRDVTNTAKVTTQKKSLNSPNKFAQSEQKVKIDERFLWKDIDDSKPLDDQAAEGLLTWKVLYRPYKTYPDNDNTSVILYDTMCSDTAIAREAGTNNLIFEGNNFTITEGSLDKYGNFTPRQKIQTGLANIFTYDKTSKTFKINIPDKRKSYKITYITYLKDRASGRYNITNSLSLYEQSHKTPIQEPKVEYSPRISSSATSRGFEKIRIVKTDKTTGQPVSGAAFKLVKPGTHYEKVILTDKNGIIDFPKIGNGDYVLTESETPEGYVENKTEYKIKVIALEIGMKIELDGEYPDVIKNGNTLTIFNIPIVSNSSDGSVSPGGNAPIFPSGATFPLPQYDIKDKPSLPEYTDTPKNSYNTHDFDNHGQEDDSEFDSSTAKNKNNNKSDDKKSTEKTPHIKDGNDIPKFKPEEVPYPVTVDSPDKIMLVDDLGNPLGVYVKKLKKDKTYEYVRLDDNTPLGRPQVKTIHKTFPAKLPKTGCCNLQYELFGCLLLVFAIYLLKKKR